MVVLFHESLLLSSVHVPAFLKKKDKLNKQTHKNRSMSVNSIMCILHVR